MKHWDPTEHLDWLDRARQDDDVGRRLSERQDDDVEGMLVNEGAAS